MKDTFTASINASSFVEFEYDDLGRVYPKKQPLDASTTAILTYSYYEDGTIRTLDTDNGTHLS